MEISAKMVKELRETTGAGMMDCKNALLEAGGDIDAAVDLLRTKGLAALAKKSSRATNEGVIAGWVGDSRNIAALAEVNCETDFVARNADFKGFANQVAAHVGQASPADISELMSQNFLDRPEKFEAVLGETVGRIGENISVSRFSRYSLSSEFGAITIYIHGVGNIGVMVELAASSADVANSAEFVELGKDVAMQIAAAAPYAVGREDVSSSTIEHELSIYKAQAAESGKPEAIQEKMAQGRLEKFFKEVTLLEQPFVKNDSLTVGKHVETVTKGIGGSARVVRFERFVLGDCGAS